MTPFERKMTPTQRKAHERAMSQRDGWPRISPADEHSELVEWLGERKAGVAINTPDNQLGVTVND